MNSQLVCLCNKAACRADVTFSEDDDRQENNWQPCDCSCGVTLHPDRTAFVPRRRFLKEKSVHLRVACSHPQLVHE